jgi:hypothetical protein
MFLGEGKGRSERQSFIEFDEKKKETSRAKFKLDVSSA